MFEGKARAGLKTEHTRYYASIFEGLEKLGTTGPARNTAIGH